jgi:hypothetical protein
MRRAAKAPIFQAKLRKGKLLNEFGALASLVYRPALQYLYLAAALGLAAASPHLEFCQ